MSFTLQERAARAALKRKIAEDTLAARHAAYAVQAYTNENLRQTRKRKLGWTSPASPERDLSRADRRKAMAMARQRIEENPIYKAIASVRADLIVGSEYRLRMTSGDKGYDKEVEAWWETIKDRLDIRGMRSWGRMQRCLMTRRDVDGDVGCILAAARDGSPALQIIEADRIDRVKPDEARDGIEFDSVGRPTGYYVVDSPSDPKKESRYTPDQFIYFAADSSERAARRRGTSVYLESFAIGQDHADILDGMVQKVKNVNFMGLHFRLNAGNPFGGAASVPTTAGADYSKVRLVPGTNIITGKDEEVSVVESATPNAEFRPFEKTLLTRMAWPVGLTYALVAGDFEGLNYSVARAMLMMVEKRLAPEQAELAALSSRVFVWALRSAIAGKAIVPPSKMAASATRHRWGVPRFPYLNPLQEANADRARIEAGLASRQSILSERGDEDFDDVADDLKYEMDGMGERGIPLTVTPGSQQPLQTEPSAE